MTATVAARSTRHTMTEQAQGLRACGQCWADRLGVDDDSARQRLRATGGLASLKVKETHHSRAVVRHDVRAVGLVRKATAFGQAHSLDLSRPFLGETPALAQHSAFHTRACAVSPQPALSDTVLAQSWFGPSQCLTRLAHAFPAHTACSCRSLAYPAEREGQVRKRRAPARCQRVCRRSKAPPALPREPARATFEAHQPAGRAPITTGGTVCPAPFTQQPRLLRRSLSAGTWQPFKQRCHGAPPCQAGLLCLRRTTIVSRRGRGLLQDLMHLANASGRLSTVPDWISCPKTPVWWSAAVKVLPVLGARSPKLASRVLRSGKQQAHVSGRPGVRRRARRERRDGACSWPLWGGRERGASQRDCCKLRATVCSAWGCRAPRSPL